MSVLVCPGWGQALRGWSEYSAFVWWAGLVVVWWVLVWLCLRLLAGFSILAWFGLSDTVQNSSSCPLSRGKTAADCRDHFSCNACIVELAGSCLHA